ncbi:hypothetical protein [Spongiibacter sp.]|uniref:hypothetical protein n=1 Tax=Spongiibacter sp. TaxID=2024860 RepID=UPI003563BD5F
MSALYANLLNFAGRRYLKWAAMLLAVSVLLYLSQDIALPRNGGSWQGYALGSIGLLLIVWLSCLGIRKRDYNNQRGSLQAWVSAHIYLGLALPLIATLHCAFQFGNNVHTLAYLLMWTVVISGAYGLYSYLRYPLMMIGNRANKAFDERLKELEDSDQNGREVAAQCNETVNAIVNSAIDRSSIGGGFLDQLLARDRSTVLLPGDSGELMLRNNVGQQAAIDFLAAKIPATSKSGEAEKLRDLLSLLGRRAELLRRLRQEISLQLRLKVWLSAHVPLTAALLVALVAHVISVFFYW